MSSDAHGTGRPLHRYRLLSIGVIAALGLAAAALALLNLAQGPRLESVQVNAIAVTEQAGQTLALQANQPIAEVEPGDVSVSPEAPFEVEQAENGLVVRFATPLHYATDYTVTARVRGAHTGAVAELETTFVTDDPLVTTLVRTGEGDRLEQQRLVSGDDHRVLLEAERLQEYALLNDQILAVTLDADGGDPGVGSISRADSSYTPFVDAQLFGVSQLRVEPRTRVAGYLLEGTDFGGTDYRGFLLLHDLRFGSSPPVQVLGPSLQPLEVEQWRFEPGTTTAVIEASDGLFYRFDPLGEDVAAKPISAEEAQGEDPLRTSERTIERVGATGELVAAGAGGSRVRIADAAGSRELFAPAAESSRVGRLCLSPNGEYLAVEVISAEGEPDGYAGEPGFTNTTTSFVRIADGEAVRSANGMLSSWCTEG